MAINLIIAKFICGFGFFSIPIIVIVWIVKRINIKNDLKKKLYEKEIELKQAQIDYYKTHSSQKNDTF